EEFARLEALRWTGVAEGDTDGYLRVKGAKGLPPRGLAAFRELHRWRETVAERDDKAPFRVIGNDSLLAVSKALPATPSDLAGLPKRPRRARPSRGAPALAGRGPGQRAARSLALETHHRADLRLDLLRGPVGLPHDLDIHVFDALERAHGLVRIVGDHRTGGT